VGRSAGPRGGLPEGQREAEPVGDAAADVRLRAAAHEEGLETVSYVVERLEVTDETAVLYLVYDTEYRQVSDSPTEEGQRA
jgi:hypothetical protein